MTPSGSAPGPGASFDWHALVVLLRTELQEYGGLLQLLDSEQERIFTAPGSVSRSSESIVRQYGLALKCTQIRLGGMRDTNSLAGRRNVTPGDIIGKVPSDARPLLVALFAEVEKLAIRATDRTHQNEWLRKRAPILAATKADRDGNGR